jgi:hypothetical protein
VRETVQISFEGGNFVRLVSLGVGKNISKSQLFEKNSNIYLVPAVIKMQQGNQQLKELLMHQAARLDGIDARFVSQGAQIDAKFAKQDQMLETMMSMMSEMMMSGRNNGSNNDAAARIMKTDEDLNTAETIEIDENLLEIINTQAMVEYCQEHFPELLEVR